MRSQVNQGRFSLIFGAGLSKAFGIPNWAELVAQIAADSEVQGEKILERFSGKGSLPYKTELLFQHFRSREAAIGSERGIGSPEFENITAAKWLNICKNHLYSGIATNLEKAVKDHVYLLKLLHIVQNTPITITYNFDDFLEYALSLNKKADDGLGYETVTSPWTQFSRRTAVIYHPHGMLPRVLMEFPRDRLVFSESAYAKLFLGALSGDFSFLLNHLSKNTCLIVGSSLEDEDLRNLLVQSANGSPGNPHYYIQFLEGKESIITREEANAIGRANFQVYNLVTLFLNQDEIAALADLLNSTFVDDTELGDTLIELDGTAKFRFYLTGAVGVGKSTTTTQLRSLLVVEEWVEPRLPLLAKPWKDLTATEKDQVDKWIANQFRIKNDRLRHQSCGIALIDRPPMDPLAFTPEAERSAKARSLLETICPKEKWDIEDGMIIFLTGDTKQMAARIATTGREYDADQLTKMEEVLRSVYSGTGVEVIDTRGRSVADVTKAVSEIVHLHEYKLFGIGERLKAMKSKKTDA